jgi:hypothetical protein
MKTFEIRNGTSPDATLVGRECAWDEKEAIETLRAYQNGFKVTDPGRGVPNAYVDWAHEDIEKLPPPSFTVWRADPVT